MTADAYSDSWGWLETAHMHPLLRHFHRAGGTVSESPPGPVSGAE